MAEEKPAPKFPELAVDKLVKDFGKKPSPEKVKQVKELAETLRPDYERVEAARRLAQQKNTQERKLGRRR